MPCQIARWRTVATRDEIHNLFSAWDLLLQ
jgi:hypothetical protein